MIRQFNIGDLEFLFTSCQWTILLSLVAFIGGGLLGLVVALGRISKRVIIRYATTSYIRVIQGTPLLMQLFLAFFFPTIFGIDVSPFLAASVGLTINTSAFLGDIWRGCIQSIPRGQWESSSALGLNFIRTMRLVILPQAVKIALPPTVGFLVQLVKATSLTAIIGFTELTRAGQLLVNSTYRPLFIFLLVAGIYFAMCWPLTVMSERIERRLSRGQ
jgi:polar amino acid transport system permease protein